MVIRFKTIVDNNGVRRDEETATMFSASETELIFRRFLNNRQVGKARIRLYEVLRIIVMRYEERSGVQMLDFSSDSLKGLYHFVIYEDYLSKGSSHVRRSHNYATLILKALRTVFNWIRSAGFVKVSPFDYFSIPSERYASPIYLSIQELDIIWKADLSDKPALAIQRDIFIFQCNVGCRVGDLMRLTKQDIVNGTIEYIPKKTLNKKADTVTVPLNRTALEILDRYRSFPGEMILPFISVKNYNLSIKKILQIAGIDYQVIILDPVTGAETKVKLWKIASSHLARRTFIGNLYKSVKDPSLISSMTGHAEGSRAFCRYRNIDIEIKRDLVKLLEMGK